jgi:hypothetical protein
MIDVPPSSGYVYRSRDWKILLDPLDQEVHRERSGQTVFIILVSERQVDHGANGVDADSDRRIGGVSLQASIDFYTREVSDRRMFI